MKETKMKSGDKGVKYWMPSKGGGYIGASKAVAEMTIPELKKYKREEAQKAADRAVEEWYRWHGNIIDYVIKEKTKELQSHA